MSAPVMTNAEWDARHTAARQIDELATAHPEHADGWRHIALGLLIERDPAIPPSFLEIDAADFEEA